MQDFKIGFYKYASMVEFSLLENSMLGIDQTIQIINAPQIEGRPFRWINEGVRISVFQPLCFLLGFIVLHMIAKKNVNLFLVQP